MEITHRRAFGLKNSDAVIVGSNRIYIDGLDFYLYDLKPPEQSWERHLLRPFGGFYVSRLIVGLKNSLDEEVKHAAYDLGLSKQM